MSIFGSSCDKLAFTVKFRVKVKKETPRDSNRMHSANKQEMLMYSDITCNLSNIDEKIYRILEGEKPSWFLRRDTSTKKHIPQANSILEENDLVVQYKNQETFRYSAGLDIERTVFLDCSKNTKAEDVVEYIKKIVEEEMNNYVNRMYKETPSMYISITNFECKQCDEGIDRDSKNSGGRGRY